ncbi:hypothetical protein D3C76_1749520 [compost metagenome]
MGTEEDINIARFNIKDIRKYREEETLGDAYRKPYAYKELLLDNPKYPFIRQNSRRNHK